ncbi:MAG: Ig-like domain-containing protein, partial [bacterium]
MVNIFKKSCPLFLLFITACGKNFAIDDLGLTLASLRLNPQLTNKMLVTLTGTCDPTKGIVTITPDVDPVTHVAYFAPASLKVTCKSPGTFSADVTLSSGDGLKSALLVQEKDTALGAIRLDMTSPNKPVVTSPVNGEKITTTNFLQNLVPKVSGTGEVDATVKVTSLSSSCTTTVDASGKWSCFLEPLLPNGVHMMNVSQVDLAGNTSAVTSLLVEIISNGGVTPSAPTILTPVGGIFLKDINQTLTGQCDSTASVVNVTGSIVDDSMFGLVGNKSIFKTTCSGAGTYSVSLKLVAGDGVKNISVSQIVNGSASYPTTATYILDTVAPDAPVISSPLAGTNVIDTTPVVRGTGLAGSFVKVKAGVNLSSKADATCEATVAASGNWFCELYPAITPPSVIDIEVTQVDLANNPSVAAKSSGVKVDPTLLASPTIITPAFGSFLNTLTATVSGTCTDGNTVTFIGNITPAISVACAGGNYTANVTFVAGEGSKMLQATQTDSNGVVSLPSVVHYMFDNVPPSIPVVTSPAEGVFVNNNQTTISGTGVVSSIVTVTATGGTPSKTSTCQATVNNSNKWSCSLNDVLNDGVVTVSAVQADSAGNVSASSSNVSFTIDTSIPSSPTVDDPTSGISLNLAAQKIKGTCTSGLIVELRGNIVGSPVTGTCAGNQYEINVQLSQENKLNTIAALQRNQAGTASPSVTVSYKWDTVAPGAPVISSPPNGSIIADKTPTVSGTGEAGATVYVTSLAPNNRPCVALVNPNRTWSCDLTLELDDGTHTITALQKDLAGNESSKASVSITIDPNAGAAPLIQDPSSGATLASAVQDISVSCLKDMTVKLTGNILNSPVTKICSSSSSPEKIQVTFAGSDG